MKVKKASLSDLEIDSFEKSLQYDIKNYDLDLKDEIGFASQKLDV